MTNSELTDAVAFLQAEVSIARAQAHQAAQLITRAARANLPAADDDSHSSFSWHQEERSFNVQSLKRGGPQLDLGIRIEDLTIVLRGEGGASELPLHGKTTAQAAVQVDGILEEYGLSPVSGVALPYELPADVLAVTQFEAHDRHKELKALASWFGFAAGLLNEIVEKNDHLKPGPGPVRCWPHHFDIATYISLETGDAETAKGVGVGLSPGDGTYGQPYFYINPWPHLDVSTLPAAPTHGHWHTEGFVGLIATSDELDSTNEKVSGARQFLASGLAIALDQLAR